MEIVVFCFSLELNLWFILFRSELDRKRSCISIQVRFHSAQLVAHFSSQSAAEHLYFMLSVFFVQIFSVKFLHKLPSLLLLPVFQLINCFLMQSYENIDLKIVARMDLHIF